MMNIENWGGESGREKTPQKRRKTQKRKEEEGCDVIEKVFFSRQDNCQLRTTKVNMIFKQQSAIGK